MLGLIYNEKAGVPAAIAYSGVRLYSAGILCRENERIN